MGSESFFGLRSQNHRKMMTESRRHRLLKLESWYDIFGQESVTIFNVGPDRSLSQVKLGHAVIYHDNSQKPFMNPKRKLSYAKWNLSH